MEATILCHPDVEKCCVIGVPDPKFGEGIKAVCVKTMGSDLNAEDLIAFVGARIARYKKPRYVVFVDSLPEKTGHGVDRQEVKRLYG